LRAAHPLDSVDDDGEPYWTGTRAWPGQIDDASADDRETFATKGLELRRQTFSLGGSDEQDDDDDERDDDDDDEQDDDETSSLVDMVELGLAKVVRAFGSAEEAKGALREVSFDKDDEDHLAFVTAAANLRGHVFAIPPVDSLRCKQIAGRVIPAVATTTSVVSALAFLEFLKLVDKPRGGAPRNSFVNLATPDRWTRAEPFPCDSWTLPDGRVVDPWTKIPPVDVEADLPLATFLRRILHAVDLPTKSWRVRTILRRGPNADLLYLDALHRDDLRPARDLLLLDEDDDDLRPPRKMEQRTTSRSGPNPDFIDVDVFIAEEDNDDDDDDEPIPLPPIRLKLLPPPALAAALEGGPGLP